ncbi:MAG: WYL domain-containing protein, partial [Actinomycetota bacterium]
MSPRVPAESEIRRILAMVPWILAHPGCTRAEIGARFGISESRVVADLRRILLIGAPPFGGGDYIDVIDDDDDGGGVTIHLGDAFRRPLRLHPADALHVLVAGRALLGVPGAEADGPLASALTKIE